METPDLPQFYAQKIASIINKIYPKLPVVIISNERIRVDGSDISLIDIYRLGNNSNDTNDRIKNYISKILSFDKSSIIDLISLKSHILPRIYQESVINTNPGISHSYFVNNTIICYVLDFEDIMVSITNQQVMDAGLNIDELDAIARENLAIASLDIKSQLVKTVEGSNVALILHNDGYDSSRLILPDLHSELSPHLGNTFYAAIPSRDMLICFPTKPDNLVSRLTEKIQEDYKKYPHPISNKLFLVTMDGVAGTLN